MDSTVYVSFVHGYHNDDVLISRNEIPCLLSIDPDRKNILDTRSLFFPRTPEDFYSPLISSYIIGSHPKMDELTSFKKLPRFGLMGLAQDDQFLYAAAWNGIYKLELSDLSLSGFITHQLISDPHGICINEGRLYSILTALDLVVITELATGKVLDYFSIDRELKISRDKSVEKYDWRFISKQHRGAVGNWHFNHIEIHNNKILLTSRLASCLVEIDLSTLDASLRTICWDTPVMIHDGRIFDNEDIVFTSVDGKILIANHPDKINSSISSMSNENFHSLMKRDLVNTSIRLGSIIGREINWCRGIEDIGSEYITTTDGRYDQDHPYFNIAFINKENKSVKFLKVGYELVDFPDEIRYMTGFSILKKYRKS